jgi:hypothetical protein
MLFGKHKGAGEIPTMPLVWLAGRADLGKLLGAAVLEGLRPSETTSVLRLLSCLGQRLIDQFAGAGRRLLANKLHTDAGGTHHDFVRLSEVTHWLTYLIGSSS